jgi:hypothetical protein
MISDKLPIIQRVMKTFILLLVTIFTYSSIAAQSASFKHLLGKWEGKDLENTTTGLEIVDSSKLYLVYGGEKKEVASYRADFSKNPAWLDLTLKDSTEIITIRTLMSFINDNLLKWQLFESENRPEHFASDRGEIIYLRRAN